MSAFLEKILISLAMAVLQWAAKKASSEAKKYSDKIALDKKRGEINHANIEKYNSASTEAQSLNAALDLLNGRS